MVKCCLKCPDRAVGCHGSCETYKREREKFVKEKAAKDEKRKADREFQCYLHDRPKNRKAARKERER